MYISRRLFIFLQLSAPSNSTRYVDVALAVLHISKFKNHIIFLIFILFVIVFRKFYRHMLVVKKWVPESLLLLIIGVVYGFVLNRLELIGLAKPFNIQLTPRLFFDFLLPPIILDSSYSLFNRAVCDHLLAIMIFAVLGTILNFFTIAFFMWAVQLASLHLFTLEFTFTPKDFFLFSSIIIAVDPVAVLAIFQDIGVDMGLYYIVFGESLFNDAVTVALYSIMSQFGGNVLINGQAIVKAFISFLLVSFGGAFIGILFGIITCLLTRMRISLAPAATIALAYFSYLAGDSFGWSGIIAMICCGLTHTAYAFHNMELQETLLARKVVHMTAELCESAIFLFIGREICARHYYWPIGFYTSSIMACILARMINVPLVSLLINKLSPERKQISSKEQVVIIAGGLRGAVSLCLAILVNANFFAHDGEIRREILICSTLFVIVATMLLGGTSMPLLVKLLKIPLRSDKQISLFTQLNDVAIAHMITWIKIFARPRFAEKFRVRLGEFEKRVVRRLLLRESTIYKTAVVKTHHKLLLQLHYASLNPDQAESHVENLPETIRLPFIQQLRQPTLGQEQEANEVVIVEPEIGHLFEPVSREYTDLHFEFLERFHSILLNKALVASKLNHPFRNRPSWGTQSEAHYSDQTPVERTARLRSWPMTGATVVHNESEQAESELVNSSPDQQPNQTDSKD